MMQPPSSLVKLLTQLREIGIADDDDAYYAWASVNPLAGNQIRRGRRGKMFIPPELQDYKKGLVEQFSCSINCTITSLVRVDVVYGFQNRKMRGGGLRFSRKKIDLDNLNKLTYDALKYNILSDDDLIVAESTFKVDYLFPFVLVRVKKVGQFFASN
jgi:Holliday junction resolvase RusA-like endonuclease